MTFFNLTNNDADGLPEMFLLRGRGRLQFGTAFRIEGFFDAGQSRGPAVERQRDGALVRGALTDARLVVSPIRAAIDIKPGSEHRADQLEPFSGRGRAGADDARNPGHRRVGDAVASATIEHGSHKTQEGIRTGLRVRPGVLDGFANTTG